jgi:hypothetical protein
MRLKTTLSAYYTHSQNDERMNIFNSYIHIPLLQLIKQSLHKIIKTQLFAI